MKKRLRGKKVIKKKQPLTFREKVQSPWGTFSIEASGRGVVRLNFPEKGKESIAEIRRASSQAKIHLKRAQQILERYFRGESVRFQEITFDLSGHTKFEEKVLKALIQVPSGKTVTYAALAVRAGSSQAARAVGSVMRKNPVPILLPCHRVIGSRGALGGYSQGPRWKKRLMKLEQIECCNSKKFFTRL